MTHFTDIIAYRAARTVTGSIYEAPVKKTSETLIERSRRESAEWRRDYAAPAIERRARLNGRSK